MLTDSNYCLWTMKMKILPVSVRCITVLEGTGDFDQSKDDDEFAALTQSVMYAVMINMAVVDGDTATCTIRRWL